MRHVERMVPMIVVALFSTTYGFSGGDGSPESPYEIATAAELLSIGSDTVLLTKHYLLTADIDLNPIVTSLEPFNTAIIAPEMDDPNVSIFDGVPYTGSFDGGGHTILNLTILDPNDFNPTTKGNSFLGLFGKVGPNGRVENLVLENVSITAEDTSCYIGALAGHNEQGTITNCSAIGNVTGRGYHSGYLGGLAGYNEQGSITDCSTTVDVTGGIDSSYLGGMVGYNIESSITDCSAAGSVAAGGWGSDYLGGLVGYNDRGVIATCDAAGSIEGRGTTNRLGGLVGQNDDGMITACNATGSVKGGDYLGGLVGYSDNGTIETCHASGSVAGDDYLGGLVGYNDHGAIATCHTSGSIAGDDNLGGLVGWNVDGVLSNCYANGVIRGDNYLGGLMGYNIDGTISDCYAIGGIMGDGCLGGLVGKSSGMITDCHASGSVTGVDYLGGLVGRNGIGTLSNCYATGSITGGGYQSDYIGGLAGYNSGTISNCFATGAVDGYRYFGGLVGYNEAGTINKCSAVGRVRGVDGRYYSGGLVGYNDSGTITHSYSTSNITTNTIINSLGAGGLVGYNVSNGRIANCYATGNVEGGNDIWDHGGLAGYNSGTISNCYAAGSVSGYVFFGGLVGYGSGTITHGYFLHPDDGGGPINGRGEPLTDIQMRQQASFIGWDFVGGSDDGDADIWGMPIGGGYPLLTWQGGYILFVNLAGEYGITILDYAVFAAAWQAADSEPLWNAVCDFNENGIIDLPDLCILLEHWLKE